MLKPILVIAVLANTCILSSQAHNCNKPNEHYESCARTCPPDTCESIGKTYFCPKQPPPDCKGECRCDKGFYRNRKGDCVCEEECEPRCGKDEIYEERPAYLCRAQACSELGYPLNCTSSDSSNSPNPRCVCDDNKVKDSEDCCIPTDECPSCGGDPNAVLGCGVNCGRLCSNYKDKDVVCPAICFENACDCKKDYVYDENLRKCVLPKDCTPTCGINEVFTNCSFSGCRRWRCSESVTCVYPIRCQEGCDCKEGYTRDNNGKCIPENQCPVPQCGKDERYEECPDKICAPKACSQLGFPLNCTSSDSSKCPGKPGCICDNDKVRDKKGYCVPRDQCPSCGGDPNAVSGCGVNCGRLCSNYKDKNVKCIKICYDNACDCRKDHVFDENLKKCVRPDECTPTCGINEVYDGCANGGCRRRKCSEGTICIDPKKCKGGCVCQEGYTRDKNGKCIPENHCPESQCGKDEKYEECPDNICEPKTCSQLGYPLNCTSSSNSDSVCSGKPGCICADDKVRDSEGRCIPKDQCPSCGGDSNAVSGCGVNCGRLCSNYKDENVACIEICYENACDCRKDHVFDENLKKCVRPDECTPTCGINEVYDGCANGGCRRRKCSEGTICIHPKKCKGGCVCQEGYTRDKNGKCIPENHCPESQCGKDEKYEECPDNICEPKTCSQLGYPLNCTSSSNSNSICLEKPGCICADDKVRDSEGRCIPKDQCPSCGGDSNAVSGCGVNCGRLCSNYKDKNVACIEICYKNACDCKEGYVFDENLKKCVLPDDCTQTCSTNEVYDGCANGGCRRRKCSEGTICIRPKKCEGGCVCKEGYTRDKNGKCIPESHCPESQCGKDEKYEECPDNICEPKTCSQLGYPLNCTSSGDSNSSCSGKPGCICADGKVRDSEGRCIPRDQCPSCGGDPNAQSGCGVNCGRLCSNYKENNIGCAAVCYDNACDCREDYIFDENLKKCVLPKDCTPTCGINEVFTNCSFSGCRRWSCSESVTCVYPIRCQEGCDCKEGYTRDNNGKCIPESQCPEPQCGKDEKYEECPDKICFPKTCSQLGYPLNCTESDNSKQCPGKPGCICDNDKVRDKEGSCIPKDQCPSCGGDPNAVSGCGVNCGRLCSNYKDKDVVCPAICYDNACDCKKGYVYDVNLKKCVLPKDCTPTCGINEVYDTCANGGCRRWKCSEQTKCVDPAKCEDGCVCRKGYTRSHNGTCIPENQCPAIHCGKDERYEECPDNICWPKTCTQLGFPLNCTNSDNPNSACPGKPGCICDDNKVRDKEGRCVPKEQCPSCGGDPNAQSGCGLNCGRLCSNYKDGNAICPRICLINACDCKKGYVFDENRKKCVLPEKCTPTCGKNEVFDTCANGGCRKWKCSEPTICVDPLICEDGCVCREGYTRTHNGTCIPEKQCPVPQCGKYEKYDKCPDNICWPKSCSQLGYPLNCSFTDNSKSDCPGKPGCICEDGRVRDDKGHCIPTNECPSCGGDPNAVTGCGVNCGRLCSNYKQKNVFCPLICRLNACDCKEGYVFDDNLKKCVLPDDCTPTCGINEVFDTCANGGCRRWKCSESTICIDPVKCQNGCVCRKGYTRTRNGTCIPEKQCPVPECGKDERYEECPDKICWPKTCTQLGFPLNCTPSDKPCTGKSGCICDNGKVRDSEGSCVAADQCPSCGGDPNAVSGCGVNCGRLCSNYKEKNVACAAICKINGCDCRKGFVFDANLKKCVHPEKCTPVCRINEVYDTCANGGCRKWKCSEPTKCVDPAKCKDGCVCREGYTRTNNGTCIPENQCPAPKCAKDERYEECPDKICRPKKCSELGFPLNCTLSDKPCAGKPGCICDNGKVRDKEGSCVSTDQCPSCGGDPNAVSGCGVNCGRLCSNYKKKNVACPAICNINGCDCKKGFVYDENLRKCVLPEKCTPTCRVNEIYDTCANGGCRKWKCSEPIKCVDPIKCQGGCVCRKGYTRTNNGTCIPENQCPPQCTKLHEYYDDCAPTCPPQTCESIGKKYHCPIQPAVCKGACRCEKGYYRNKVGDCISEQDCKKCTRPHEYYDTCPPICPPQTCESIGQSYSCPNDNRPCKGACRCENGYLRNKKGVCVAKKDCDTCGGDPNAVPGCGVNCGRLCSNYNKGPAPCPRICRDGCDCKDEFVLDENINQCVLPENCTPICGENEVYSGCVNGGCQPKKCSDIGKQVRCRKLKPACCKKGCLCKDTYLRADNGTCIPEEQCNGHGKTSESKVNKTEAKARLDKGIIALSGQLIYQLSQSKPDENFVTSATSVMVPLAQLAIFSQNRVLDQLLNLFNLRNKNEIKTLYPEEIDYNINRNQPTVLFDMATKCYANENYPLSEKFEKDSKRYFDASAQNMNFSENKHAANIINDWVSKRTRGKIQNLVSADSLNANTVMVLVNAIYFFGNWTHQFNEKYTEKRNFTKRNNDIAQLDIMYQENNFRYAENSKLKIQAVEMPYKNGNFSFLVVLPQNGCFDETVQTLRNPDVFINITNSLSYQKVKVYLPKMMINTNIDMAEMLEKANVTDMFRPNSNGFKGILKDDDQSLYVSAAIQKAYIQINEKGTEAAAATAVVVSKLSAVLPSNIFTFNANHPFIFYLLFNDAPVFSGSFVGGK